MTFAGAGGGTDLGEEGSVGALDVCESNLCLNGGKCVEDGEGFLCECARGFTGELCELPRFQLLSRGSVPFTLPLTVSGDGKVIAGYVNAHDRDPREPFRWTIERGFETLSYSEPIDSGWAEATNSDGSVIVGTIFTPSHLTGTAFRWTVDKGIQLLGAGVRSSACCVSKNGNAVAGIDDLRNLFRWTASSGLEKLGPYTSGGSLAEIRPIDNVTSMSDDGTVMVGLVVLGEDRLRAVYRWQAGVFRRISPSGSESAFPPKVSGDGSVVVGSYFDKLERRDRVFHWAFGTMEHLDLDELTGPSVDAVNTDARVVFGSSLEGGWVWSRDTGVRMLRDVLIESGIDVPVGRLSVAGVSSNGNVVVGRIPRTDVYGAFGWIARL